MSELHEFQIFQNGRALFFGKLGHLFFNPACWWWPEVTPFFVYSAKEGRKWITKQIALKKSISHKWHNEISPSTSFGGISFGTNLRHKKRRPSFGRSSIIAANEWQGKISMKIDKSCPHCSPQLVELVEHKFYIDVLSLNMDGDMLPTSFGNSSPKKGISARESPFLCCNVCLINLCAKHLKGLVVFDTS